jgi:hypothetical protein
MKTRTLFDPMKSSICRLLRREEGNNQREVERYAGKGAMPWVTSALATIIGTRPACNRGVAGNVDTMPGNGSDVAGASQAFDYNCNTTWVALTDGMAWMAPPPPPIGILLRMTCPLFGGRAQSL